MRIVAIGGGTGLSTLLRGLKNFSVDLTAVVTVTDEGGSSGILREELSVPPPGDIRNNLVALASDENILGQVFNYRFKNGSLNGHTVGNIILAALTKITGSFTEAIAKVSDILAVKGRVLPVSNDMGRLVAEFEDGAIVKGETHIVAYGKETGFAIKNVTLESPLKLNPAVKQAVEEADIIVLGPGSLYTSIIANFLVEGLSQVVAQSSAVKIYISNIMTQPGETTGYTLRKHIEEVEKFAGCTMDYIIHSYPPKDDKVLEKYREKGSEPVTIDVFHDRIIFGHFSSVVLDEDYRIRHDPLLTAQAVVNIALRKVNVK
ncbi:gluconeogenesis factor YvcK family protein [Fervidobacterium thailandense]|uniref:Putative gluconeogenesis factor n=1 Tax=Fervidobacterium thailandense TaxID=1008305 RepID=A0A1E3G3K7_9BACT|nr:gluconeogenesis factor YvcK family protein [Fervidobacterium thailandense]ODN30837.1 hypothetical protein A4H02_02920 [Fervidobacterium thailandense]